MSMALRKALAHQNPIKKAAKGKQKTKKAA